LKPGGDIFFSTINRNLKSFLFAIVGAEYVLSLLPRGTHDYKKLIRPSELDQWSRTSGLSIKDITGMHYNPLSKKYRLGPGVAVNYLAHYRKPE
ncbi:MAG: bifunctional 2-polyprenyl-6-hydroxyphenol methylase/3-demethylubiquinol 3-O-methyltransferase UbiG, partial [Pseudomonadota bacterium]